MIRTAQSVSLDDYRQMEQVCESRHEYHDGEVWDIAGASLNHNTIVVNLIARLKSCQTNPPLRLFSSDMRLWIPQYRRGLYPDIMVVLGDVLLNGDRDDEILNPSLIIEVLSPSTATFDRGDKFLFYRSIPQFQDYLLISQSDYHLEHYRRTSTSQWLFDDYLNRNCEILLPSLGITLNGEEIYADVQIST
jgi:Uma2 family endonuclease